MDCLHGGKHLRLQLIGFLQLPNRMITLLLIVIGFAGGFYAGLKNANSSKVEKAKSIIDQLKGK
jgi:hypothetical protein